MFLGTRINAAMSTVVYEMASVPPKLVLGLFPRTDHLLHA